MHTAFIYILTKMDI